MVIDLAEVRRDVIGMALAHSRGDLGGVSLLMEPYEADELAHAALHGAMIGVIWGLAVLLARTRGQRPEDFLVSVSLEQGKMTS